MCVFTTSTNSLIAHNGKRVVEKVLEEEGGGEVHVEGKLLQNKKEVAVPPVSCEAPC